MTNKTWNSEQVALQTTLKQIRGESGLTQTELANLLGKKQSFVSKYESGERKLDYFEVKAILVECGITITKFDNRLSKTLG
ncbi:hypothetical protein A9Q81_19330 [Gammaproteobacteria bacterium 42_54_T18]|nr:hypothetical protein A9Q81_19330 [Gammaproteobacteria bacterium 42_54_T18]